MSPPAELVDQVERMAFFHADMWAIDHPRTGTQAEYVHALVSTTMRHLLEVGLLVVAGDAADVLAAGVEVGPMPSTWPVPAV